MFNVESDIPQLGIAPVKLGGTIDNLDLCSPLPFAGYSSIFTRFEMPHRWEVLHRSRHRYEPLRKSHAAQALMRQLSVLSHLMHN
jgi:hypothetical protein